MSQTAIDIKDLHEGSYVQDETGRVFQINLFTRGSGICDFEARSIDNNPPNCRICKLFDLDKTFPVTITPEWLQRLGFCYYGTTYELLDGHQDGDESYTYTVCSVNWAQTSVYFTFTDSSERAFDIAIHSVHQLQAVLWNLERIWLTILEEEVSHG